MKSSKTISLLQNIIWIFQCSSLSYWQHLLSYKATLYYLQINLGYSCKNIISLTLLNFPKHSADTVYKLCTYLCLYGFNKKLFMKGYHNYGNLVLARMRNSLNNYKPFDMVQNKFYICKLNRVNILFQREIWVQLYCNNSEVLLS